ncbi:MAG: nucleoside deaminase [Armatimonadetes bacterium]|nr:nucleoside deaminase [Armatimonadota bacterium]
MREALREAEEAFAENEVPVGAVAVFRNEVIARGHNQRETYQDPLSHAEMQVIREASRRLETWRLNEVTVFVTLEPCAMCSGAMVQARVGGCVYGTADPKAGVAGSVLPVETILSNPSFNHRVLVRGGVLGEACTDILRKFFENLRKVA